MKKIISFEKKIEFPSMIGEICTISLDHDLKFVNENHVEGNFIVSGTYKLTEASRIEDKFEYKLPAEIVLKENIDLKTAKIEINDFYYEIEEEENLICFIDVNVEGVEMINLPEEIDLNISEIQKEELNNIRECDGDKKEEYENIVEVEKYEKENDKEIIEKEDNKKDKKKSLFSELTDDEDAFSTYTVYIIRENESIETILNKYKITKEELEEYNDLSNIKIGCKIIIPITNEN